jgi:hypothetical protein
LTVRRSLPVYLAIGRDVGPPHILSGRFSMRKVGFFVSLFLRLIRVRNV